MLSSDLGSTCSEYKSTNVSARIGGRNSDSMEATMSMGWDRVRGLCKGKMEDWETRS